MSGTCPGQLATELDGELGAPRRRRGASKGAANVFASVPDVASPAQYVGGPRADPGDLRPQPRRPPWRACGTEAGSGGPGPRRGGSGEGPRRRSGCPRCRPASRARPRPAPVVRSVANRTPGSRDAGRRRRTCRSTAGCCRPPDRGRASHPWPRPRPAPRPARRPPKPTSTPPRAQPAGGGRGQATGINRQGGESETRDGGARPDCSRGVHRSRDPPGRSRFLVHESVLRGSGVFPSKSRRMDRKDQLFASELAYSRPGEAPPIAPLASLWCGGRSRGGRPHLCQGSCLAAGLPHGDGRHDGSRLRQRGAGPGRRASEEPTATRAVRPAAPPATERPEVRGQPGREDKAAAVVRVATRRGRCSRSVRRPRCTCRGTRSRIPAATRHPARRRLPRSRGARVQ